MSNVKSAKPPRKRKSKSSVDVGKVREVGAEMWGVMAAADLNKYEAVFLLEQMVAEMVYNEVPEESWSLMLSTFSVRVIELAQNLHARGFTIH